MSADPAVALIGCGRWGKNLARVFNELGVLRLVCETDPLKLGGVPEGVPNQLEFSASINRSDVSAVAIATPAETHYSLARQALLAGKDVFVEKPMSLCLSDCLDLQRIAEANGLMLMVGHLLEYHAAIKDLSIRVEQGELGTIRYAYSNRLNFGAIRTTENALMSLAPHDISVILRVVGYMPFEVCAFGGGPGDKQVRDTSMSCLRFRRGLRAHVFVSWLHPFKEQRLTVVGDKKMAVFDGTSADRQLAIYDQGASGSKSNPIAERRGVYFPEVPTVEPLLAECRHFVECIKNRTEPLTGPASAIRVMRVLDGCQKSMSQEGRRVSISEK